MTLIYHGTSLQNGLAIARSGAIKSPWQLWIDHLLALEKKDPGRMERQHGTTSVEDLAFVCARSGYPEREWAFRVKSLSVTDDFVAAKQYAAQQVGTPGIVLALGFNPAGARGAHYCNNGTIYIPRQLSLDTLEYIYVHPNSVVQQKAALERAYQRYSVGYGLLC